MIGNVIIPIDSYFSGVLKPPTSSGHKKRFSSLFHGFFPRRGDPKATASMDGQRGVEPRRNPRCQGDLRSGSEEIGAWEDEEGPTGNETWDES